MNYFTYCALALILLGLQGGCRNHTKQDIGYESSGDTTRLETNTDSQQTSEPKADTSRPPLLPIPDPIPTDRLAEFLPSMSGYQPGELQQETKVRPNFKSSKVLQTYSLGDKKFAVEINDY